MNAAAIVLRLIAGIVLGLFFYGGLWLTVRHVSHAQHLAWHTLASFWLRSAVVVAGFLLLVDRRWEYVVLCFAGFIAARLAVSKLLPGRRSFS